MIGQCGCPSCNIGPFEIFTNQDKTMNLRAVYQGTGVPLDLTSCTEIEVNLPLAAGGFVSLLLSLSQVTINSPATIGSFSVPITHTVAATLMVQELQNVDVAFTIGGLITTVRFCKALTVIQF